MLRLIALVGNLLVNVHNIKHEVLYILCFTANSLDIARETILHSAPKVFTQFRWNCILYKVYSTKPKHWHVFFYYLSYLCCIYFLPFRKILYSIFIKISLVKKYIIIIIIILFFLLWTNSMKKAKSDSFKQTFPVCGSQWEDEHFRSRLEIFRIFF